MIEELHAIIVDKSLSDLSVLKKLNIISQTKDGGWILYKISIDSSEVDKTIRMIHSNMAEGNWYFHFYNKDGSRLIIVFRDRVIETNNNPSNWASVIEYGKSLGIPTEQLDFSPNTFKTETY